MFAKDFMTTSVATIHATNSVHTAIEMMLKRGVSGLPVIDDEDQLVGMITEGDLLRRVEFGASGKQIGISTDTALADLDDYIHGHSWRVGDLMTANVMTVTADTPIGQVARILYDNRIKRLPVVDGNRLVGLISRVDLLRAVVDIREQTNLTGDEAIERAIKSRLHSDIGINLEDVTVSVRDRVVTLEGAVTSEIQRRAVRVLIENVKGIEGYTDKLTGSV